MAAERRPDITTDAVAELHAWRKSVLNILLAVLTAVATLLAINSFILAVRDPSQWPQTIPFLAAYAFLLALTLLYRLDLRLRTWGLLVVGYAVGVMYLAILGLLGNGMLFLLAMPLLAAVLLGPRPGLVLAGLSLAIYVVFAFLASLGVMDDWLIIQENSLEPAQWFSQGLSFAALLTALVVIQTLFSQAQNRILSRVQQTAAELSTARDQLQAHSEESDRYARLLEVGALVSRETASLLDIDELLDRTVHLIAQQLDFDQVAVYLVGGPDQITLAAAARPRPTHELTSLGVVSQVIGERTQQGSQSPADGQVHHELTLPLLAAGQAIGALDVHATRPISFSEQEISALQGMADLLALALENARLFTETQASLRELDALYRHYTVEAWQRFESERTGLTHRWQSTGELSGEVWQALSAQARSSGNVATGFDEQSRLHLLVAPVKLREVPIGVLGFHRPAEAGPWEREQIAAIKAVAERLAPAAENLRLLDETQRRAARERVVSEISTQVRASLDPDAILKTGVREIGRLLGAERVSIEITGPGGSNGNPKEI